jgi:hypothetical protein
VLKGLTLNLDVLGCGSNDFISRFKMEIYKVNCTKLTHYKNINSYLPTSFFLTKNRYCIEDEKGCQLRSIHMNKRVQRSVDDQDLVAAK